MQVAITIRDSRERQGTAIAAPWQALSDCLSTHDQFVSQPGRRACDMLVSSRQTAESEQRYLEEFLRCRAHMPHAVWLRDMHLRFWEEPVEPLPLELAHIVAASVAHCQLHEEAPNPIFDAVLTKLAHNPFKGKRLDKRKRR
jgi:hypothetical protein